MLARIRAAGLLWPTLFALAALAVLIGLGTWQMQRKAWKDEIVATIAARAKAPPLAHAESLKLVCQGATDRQSRSCEYLRIRLRGTFDHAGERHVFAGAQGAAGRAEVGYWIFTPFHPSALPQLPPIYVNRGFAPERLKAQAERVEGQLTGVIEIVAQIRRSEARMEFAGSNDRTRNIYFVRNPMELAGTPVPTDAASRPFFGNLAHYLELVEGTPPGGYPKPLAGQIVIPNRHLEYALTWYGLALTLIGVYVAFARGRLRQPSP